jgi:hypothetical protein
MSFLTFCLNFSLIVRNCTNFSLLTLNFSLLATYLGNFSLFARISHFLPLFQWNSHFPSNFSLFQQSHSHAGRPTPTPAFPMTWLMPHYWRARAGWSPFVKSEKFRVLACKKWEIQMKVRNLCNPAGKVRNSSQKWEKFEPKVSDSRGGTILRALSET